MLKDNRIASLGTALHSCRALRKLSMAHNQLTDLGSALVHCLQPTELRLSHNQLTSLPGALAANKLLTIVELGGNPIAGLQAVKVAPLPTSSLPLNVPGRQQSAEHISPC